MAIMAMTTSNSISVNPRLRRKDGRDRGIKAPPDGERDRLYRESARANVRNKELIVIVGPEWSIVKEFLISFHIFLADLGTVPALLLILVELILRRSRTGEGPLAPANTAVPAGA